MPCLFHVSDVHFGAEDPAALAWFQRCVEDERPDAIIMTGDLTMRARSREFEAAAKWLEGLGRPTTVEVGNHDLPYFNLFRRLFRPYKRYLKLERMIERPLAIADLMVVPLRTTARLQLRNWSKGVVNRRSLKQALATIAAAPAGATILVAAHHPLIEAGTQATGKTRRGDKSLALLAEAGAHAVLSGHVHDAFDVAVEEGGRTIRMIGAGTLSRRTRATRASFNAIEVGEGGRIEVMARVMD